MANRERLIQLAAFLEELDRPDPGQHFNMGTWGYELVSHALERRHEPGRPGRPGIQEDAGLRARAMDCNSPGCIAGWTNILFPAGPIPFNSALPDATAIEEHAARALGLNEGQKQSLFLPQWVRMEIIVTTLRLEHVADRLRLGRVAAWARRTGRVTNHVTAEDAASVIRNFAATGNIDWSDVLEKYRGKTVTRDVGATTDRNAGTPGTHPRSQETHNHEPVPA